MLLYTHYTSMFSESKWCDKIKDLPDLGNNRTTKLPRLHDMFLNRLRLKNVPIQSTTHIYRIWQWIAYIGLGMGLYLRRTAQERRGCAVRFWFIRKTQSSWFLRYSIFAVYYYVKTTLHIASLFSHSNSTEHALSHTHYKHHHHQLKCTARYIKCAQYNILYIWITWRNVCVFFSYFYRQIPILRYTNTLHARVKQNVYNVLHGYYFRIKDESVFHIKIFFFYI